ncbi:hypothetical protein BLNAU_19679 [Blattamonas nauphoetae]|uniref:Uncharacterized protein n=1 Tax=Blattamonas nauphoetae TaxID=2049346 RepID=A0ABQ9X0Y1_9EUKA|nr:hypothetical protein BLNAU_19679 [Blattamonas nauphoetae]
MTMIVDEQTPFRKLLRQERGKITKLAWDALCSNWPSNPDDLMIHLVCSSKKCPSVLEFIEMKHNGIASYCF